jgi:hypothetical protein
VTALFGRTDGAIGAVTTSKPFRSSTIVFFESIG